MKCPHCQQELEAALSVCPACGKVLDQAALESLEQIEALLVWLDERAGSLDPEAYEQLRSETSSQRRAVRGRLGLAAPPPPLPTAVRPPAPTKIVRELALLEGTREQVQRWVELAVITSTTGSNLRRHISTRAQKLQSKLSGRLPGESDWLWELCLLDFALEALPQWAKDLLLPITEVPALRDWLNERRTAHLLPIAQELALVQAAHAQIQGWYQARAISPISASSLRRLLSARSAELEKTLAGQPVQVEPLWALQMIDNVLKALPQWAQAAQLHPGDTQSLRIHLQERQATLLQNSVHRLACVQAILGQVDRWFDAGAIGSSSAKSLHRHLSAQVERLGHELADQPIEIEIPSDLQANKFALDSLSSWTRVGHLRPTDVESLRRLLDRQRTALLKPVAPPTVPTVVQVPAAVPAAVPVPPPTPLPVPTAKPEPPPKPTRPPIDWAKVWEHSWNFVVSGALLRTLLYLGAFMIVVAVAVLVVNFWNDLGSLLQGLIIFSVPTGFYIGGWFVRNKMQLPQAGGALSGIGALLVAVNLAGIYQFGGLGLDLAPYWLITSVLCTVLYAVTAWRLPGEFFGHITLLALSSVVLALTNVLHLPLEWSIALLVALAATMVEGAARLERIADEWGELARSGRHLPLILLPIGQTFILLLAGNPAFERHAPTLGHVAAFLFASLGYGLLAWRFPKAKLAAIWVHATIWSSVGVVGLALWVAAIPWAWSATAAAVLALLYALAGFGLNRWLDDEFPLRRNCLVAVDGASFSLVGIAVVVGAIAIVFDYSWEGILALTLAALVLGGDAYLYRRPQFVLLAGALFIAPFSLAGHRWLTAFQVPQWGAWLMATWAGLALVYLGLAVLLRAAEKYGAWLNLLAHALSPIALFGLLVNYTGTADGWFAGPTLAALGGVISVYLASAVIHDSGCHPALSNHLTWLPGPLGQNIFFWPAGLLLPVWLAVAWSGNRISWPWLGAVLAGLALAYVGLGQLLARRKEAYGLPLLVYAYGLVFVATYISLGDERALLTTLYLVVGALAALAFVHRRVLETSLAALLFIWPFQLSLNLAQLSPLTAHGSSLSYALLSSLGYVPLGIVLAKGRRKGEDEAESQPYHALPLYIIGGTLAAYAVGTSLLGYFDVYPHVPWIGVAAPLIVTALLVFGAAYFRHALFAWAGALVLAITFGQTLTLLNVPWEYEPTAWVGVALVYMLIERILARFSSDDQEEPAWFQAFRWPLGIGTIALGSIGLLLTANGTYNAFMTGRIDHPFPIILAQLLAVGLTILAAWLYRSRWPLYLEPWLAFFPVTLFFMGYGEWLFGQPLTWLQFGLVWSGLGLIEVLVGVLLDRAEVRYSHGLYLAGYALAALAIFWALPDRAVLLWTLGLWILLAIGSALLVHFKRHHTWDELIAVLLREKESTTRVAVRAAFLWLAAGPFPAWCVLFLRQLNVGHGFEWLGFAVPALLLLGLALWLRRFERTYAWPLHSAAQAYTAAGLLISAPFTVRFLDGQYSLEISKDYASAYLLLQALGVLFYAASAWVFRKRLFAHVASWLIIFPVAMFLINYGEWLFGRPLTWLQFGLVWSGLGLIEVLAGVLLDRAEVRYSHGPYLAGYALAALAVFWALPDRAVLLWTLGLWILLAIGSALLVHFKRHHTWDELIAVLFRERESTTRVAVRAAFLWLAAGSFPAWCVLFLRQLNVGHGFEWLGFAVPALLLFGLALWLRRFERTYAWPLHSAAQAYTAAGLLISAPFTVRFLAGQYNLEISKDYASAYLLLQSLGVLFYAASAWVFRNRLFAHVAAWLSLAPFTLAGIMYGPPLSSTELAWIWIGWAAVLLGVGFALDRTETRYSSGPYLAGYALALFALIWSIPDRHANLYTMAGTIVLALLSQVAVHLGRHRSFDNLVDFFWRKPDTVAQRATRTVFLFFAAYAFPIWLVSTLLYHDMDLPWRGVALALTAPIYIALGLVLRRVKAEYTWPLFSAGYVLTAIGAMVTFEDMVLAITVLSLNAAVYAVSAYIFRQAFWLYLSNLLAPIIGLLMLQHNFNQLPAPWVAGMLIGLAFIYFGAGQLFDRTRRKEATGASITPFAVPFYMPGYLLSAVALAVASREQYLALIVYSAGVVLYALSAWRFREAILVYPVACLAAVPYYVTMTLIKALPEAWYGLGWLPLVVGYIAIGRLVFKGDIPAGWDETRTSIARPAMPFYLLAYGLSVSMMVISRHDPLPLTLASAAAAAVYFASAILFRRPVWLYPGLLAAHLALGAHFILGPTASWSRAYSIAHPFHGLTWAIALIGYWFSRRFPVARRTSTGKLGFKLGKHKLELGWFPFAGHLVTPSWAQAFFMFATVDVILWQVLALFDLGTAITLATGSAVLLGLFAMLWQDTVLAYGTPVFLLLASGCRMYQANLPFNEAVAWMGGIGLGLYIVARAAERVVTGVSAAGQKASPGQESITTGPRARLALLAVWPQPMTRMAILLSSLAAIVTLPGVTHDPRATALGLAFAGTLALTIAYHRRHYRLGYLGMALIEVAWVLFLISGEIGHPQLYAIPAGLYFTVVGFLERRAAVEDPIRRKRRLFALIVESLGLTILLLTSFVQSLNDTEGLPYFLLLLVEGLLIIWWGAARRIRISLFIGIGASVLNVIAQVIVLFATYKENTLVRWLIILGVGLFLVTAGVFVERQREQIIARTKDWRQELEQWE